MYNLKFVFIVSKFLYVLPFTFFFLKFSFRSWEKLLKLSSKIASKVQSTYLQVI